MSQVQIVKGYVCFDCADVALAQKDINPAHPPGSPSNPTVSTPNGLDNPNSPAGTSGARSPSAVVFGGALAGLQAATSSANPSTQTTATGLGAWLNIAA